MMKINYPFRGIIDTPMVSKARKIARVRNAAVTLENNHPALNRVGKPIEVANLVAFLLRPSLESAKLKGW